MQHYRITPQLQSMRQRIQALIVRANEPAQQDLVLSATFEELSTAMEELQAVDEELRRANIALEDAIGSAEIERQRYQELFVFAPEAYLVTGLDGTIRQANQAASSLLECQPRFLIGRALALFVPEGERRAFRSRVAELRTADELQRWELQMQPWGGAPLDVELTVCTVRSSSGLPIGLRWIMRDISQRKQAERALHARIAELERCLAERANEGDATTLKQQFAFLSEASVLLAAIHDQGAAMAHLAHLAVPIMADLCVIDIAEPQGKSIRQIVVVRDPNAEGSTHEFRRRYTPQPAARRAQAAAIEQSRIDQPHERAVGDLPRSLSDLAQDAELRTILGALAPATAIVAPLQAHGKALGSITLGSTQNHRYGSTEVALLEELARRIVLGVERMRRYQEPRHGQT